MFAEAHPIRAESRMYSMPTAPLAYTKIQRGFTYFACGRNSPSALLWHGVVMGELAVVVMPVSGVDELAVAGLLEVKKAVQYPPGLKDFVMASALS